MNSAIKSILWLAAAAAAVVFGLQVQKNREIEELQKETADAGARAKELSANIAMVRAKIEQAQVESTAGADFESKHNNSVLNVAAEQKKIDEIIGKWPAVEADRAAAVLAVREKERTRAPYSITLTDGTKMENFAVRSVQDENTVLVEHSSGLVKIPSEKLPAELKTRLGLGWKPQPPPPGMTIDKEGNAVIKQAVKQANEKAALSDAANELGLGSVDTGTLAGVTRAIAATEAMLSKTQVAFESERANIRKLEIYKPNLAAPGGKTYGALKKDANVRLVALAGRVQALRGELANLKHKLKMM